MAENVRHNCTVEFVGDHFILQTMVTVDTEDMPEGADLQETAIALASNTLLEFYRWDLSGVATEVEVVDMDSFPHF